MRIAWFTPAAGASGIVEYSRHVVAELARRVDTDVWCAGQPERFPAGVHSVDFVDEPAALELLDGYDAVFYNLGNHAHYHSEIYRVSRGHAGIVVLHDYSLHHFFAGFFATSERRPDAYRRLMAELYGWRGLEVAAGVLRGLEHRAWRDDDEMEAQPLIEPALDGATGVVVHSAWHARALRSVWHGPLCQLWLPVYPDALAPVVQAPARGPDEEVVVMTVGHVERNKQITEVIGALAADPQLATRVRYVLLGGYDPQSQYHRDLNEAIAMQSMSDRVQLLGYQPAASFQRHLAAADIFINLRQPNLEGGSASLMEQMACARPVIVYRAGSFAELPDDVVAKVPRGDRAALARRLRELVFDVDERRRLGLLAREFAQRHTVAAYARRIVEFAQEAMQASAPLELADRAGRELARIGVDPALPAADRVDEALLSLFGPGPPPPVPG